MCGDFYYKVAGGIVRYGVWTILGGSTERTGKILKTVDGAVWANEFHELHTLGAVRLVVDQNESNKGVILRVRDFVVSFMDYTGIGRILDDASLASGFALL